MAIFEEYFHRIDCLFRISAGEVLSHNFWIGGSQHTIPRNIKWCSSCKIMRIRKLLLNPMIISSDSIHNWYHIVSPVIDVIRGMKLLDFSISNVRIDSLIDMKVARKEEGNFEVNQCLIELPQKLFGVHTFRPTTEDGIMAWYDDRLMRKFLLGFDNLVLKIG